MDEHGPSIDDLARWWFSTTTKASMMYSHLFHCICGMSRNHLIIWIHVISHQSLEDCCCVDYAENNFQPSGRQHYVGNKNKGAMPTEVSICDKTPGSGTLTLSQHCPPQLLTAVICRIIYIDIHITTWTHIYACTQYTLYYILYKIIWYYKLM